MNFYFLSKKMRFLSCVFNNVASFVLSTKTFNGKGFADLVPLISSKLTDLSPTIGKLLTNAFIGFFIGNKLFMKFIFWQQQKIISNIKRYNKILIISDLNIGDAVNLQIACTTLKSIFTSVKIDYVINRHACDLVSLNNSINNVFGIFSGSAQPTNSDIEKLQRIIKRTDYDLIINFCPFFNKKTFLNKSNIVVNHYILAMEIAYNELKTNNKNHIKYKVYTYLTDLFKKHIAQHEMSFNDTCIVLKKTFINEANDFFDTYKLHNHDNIVLFNPDATSQYTKIPIMKQIELLEFLCQSTQVKHILVGSGFSQKNIEQKILSDLMLHSDKIIVIPKYIGIATYAALIDLCNVYITADTGPLHIAASYKIDEWGNPLHNKTAIFSIFGATPARIYAYDSDKQNFLKANQKAFSKVYISNSPCRNITCINKMAKKCKNILCFDGIDTSLIANDVTNYLESADFNKW